MILNVYIIMKRKLSTFYSDTVVYPRKLKWEFGAAKSQVGFRYSTANIKFDLNFSLHLDGVASSSFKYSLFTPIHFFFPFPWLPFSLPEFPLYIICKFSYLPFIFTTNFIVFLNCWILKPKSQPELFAAFYFLVE